MSRKQLRDAARAAGLKTFRGTICARGHDGVRYVSDGKCVACGGEKAAARWANNREQQSNQAKEWRRRNPERHLQNFAKWRAANQDYDRARCTARQRSRPEEYVALQARWRAARRQGCPAWVDRSAIIKIYAECRKASASGVPHEVDHIVPLLGRNVCGLHVPWNLQIIPEIDNKKKGNRFRG